MGYIGKDIIHMGCGLELDPEKALEGISHAARKNLKKAEKHNVEVRLSKGSKEDLETLRSLWYFPDDPNFPKELGPDDIMYLAYHEGRPVGGIFLIPVGQHLFLNNLTANDEGKKLQLQSFLLWHIVKNHSGDRYKYIDVGVSYRPNLYKFFDSWATFKYPVIFNSPEMNPNIHFQAFRSLSDVQRAKVDEKKISEFTSGKPYTIFPSFSIAQEVKNERSEDCELLDLTEWIPSPYGGILLGLEISETELWDTYGCFDFVKTEFIKECLSAPENSWTEIISKRQTVFDAYKDRFSIEDVDIKPKDNKYSSVVVSGELVETFAGACEKFKIGHRYDNGILELPCHQLMTTADIDFIYAIYRGVLNLCSEWMPTQVKGQLK